MIIAFLVGLVITLTRKSSAGLRYRLLCGILVLFVLSVSVTYYIEMHLASVGQLSANTTKFVNGPIQAAVVIHAEAAPQLSLFNKAVNSINQNMNIIFLVWLLFFMMRSLKMVSGLLYIQRIRN